MWLCASALRFHVDVARVRRCSVRLVCFSVQVGLRNYAQVHSSVMKRCSRGRCVRLGSNPRLFCSTHAALLQPLLLRV